MIVFDLKCPSNHVFEAWFASSAAFEDQKARGLLACPLCGADQIDKAVMAPNVAAKGNQRSEAPLPSITAPQQTPDEAKAVLAKLAQMQAALLEKSQWVGQDFAAKARAMDAGEADQALIHGHTTPEEAKALIEDGIGIMPLPFPIVPPDKQN